MKRSATIAVALGASAAVFGIGLAVMGGCLRTTQFQCTKDSQCVNAGVHGRCETAGVCSFPDMDCESGLRFGESTGAESSQCVAVDAGTDDSPLDTTSTADAPRECYGAGAYELCFTGMPPMGTVTLSGALDTTSDSRCAATLPAAWVAASQPDACLVVGHEVDVTATLTVTGTRPLVIVGETVAISALIDVASHRGAGTGAGANPSQCAAFGSAATAGNTGAGGGAGGSFMTAGGNGGGGDSATQAGGTAAAADASAPTVLRGGCAGEIGGMGTAAAGAPGPGGGAIYIAAGKLSMTSSALINVSGAGGAAGGAFSGGSGGGAGGMIVIHAFSLGATAGKLVANGGGAAAGGNSNPGVAGSDPVAGTPTTPAPGGVVSGSNGGSNGGNGFAGTTAATTGLGPSNNKGGGGGGGGGGYIRVNVALPGVTASPTATVVP